jgi:hypothetical protein
VAADAGDAPIAFDAIGALATRPRRAAAGCTLGSSATGLSALRNVQGAGLYERPTGVLRRARLTACRLCPGALLQRASGAQEIELAPERGHQHAGPVRRSQQANLEVMSRGVPRSKREKLHDGERYMTESSDVS